MANLNSNDLDHLSIIPLNEKDKKELGPAFKAPISLDSISHYYNFNYKNIPGLLTGNNYGWHSSSSIPSFQFKIILDNTCVFRHDLSPSDKSLNKEINIIKQVEYFLSMCYQEGEDQKKKTRLLKVQWGEFSRICRLNTIQIKYSVFERSGNPLRAELDVVFIEASNGEKKQEEQQKVCITENHIVRDGDNLLLVMKNKYGPETSKLYLKVADANGLNHFRNLKPGQKIKLPDFKKDGPC